LVSRCWAQHRLETGRPLAFTLPHGGSDYNVTRRRIAEHPADHRRVAIQIENQRGGISHPIDKERFFGADDPIDLGRGGLERTLAAGLCFPARDEYQIESDQRRAQRDERRSDDAPIARRDAVLNPPRNQHRRRRP